MINEVTLKEELVTTTLKQLTEEDIIEHFNKYYIHNNDIDSININMDIYNHYYDYSGIHTIYIEYEDSNSINNIIMNVNVVKKVSMNNFITILIIILLIAYNLVSKRFNKNKY